MYMAVEGDVLYWSEEMWRNMCVCVCVCVVHLWVRISVK